jgi:predicted nucleotidyltransferase component of viral defense system
MSNPSAGLVVSVHTRLVRHAKTLGVDPNLILTRFAVERFLYRLSQSRHAERFVLKGALLLLVWLGETIRPTRDADLLGFGDLSDEALARTFAELCSIDVEPDGMIYDASSIRVAAIRPEDAYGGQRITIPARLGSARLRVQVDVGVGDVVVPEPEWLDYPSLVGLPCPRLRAYRRETAIAEKVHAMVVLGSKNSRMRDFFDVHALSERESFDGDRLVQALRATFERRRTPIPSRLPPALTPAFAEPSDKRAQWRGFLRKNGLASVPTDLEQIVATLATFLAPVLEAAGRGEDNQSVWPPGGPWRPAGRGDDA